MDGSLLLCPFCNLLLVCLEMKAKGYRKSLLCVERWYLLAAKFWQKKTQASRSKHSQSTTLQCFFVFCFYQSCNLKQSKADSLACCRTELSIKNRLLWVIWKQESKDCHSVSDMNCKRFDSFLLDGTLFLTHENDVFIQWSINLWVCRRSTWTNTSMTVQVTSHFSLKVRNMGLFCNAVLFMWMILADSKVLKHCCCCCCHHLWIFCSLVSSTLFVSSVFLFPNALLGGVGEFRKSSWWWRTFEAVEGTINQQSWSWYIMPQTRLSIMLLLTHRV